MALPWFRILDAAFSLADMALRGRSSMALRDAGEQIAPARAATEARLAGVVVAALKEAFDRDSQRLVFEREQRELERRRAERLLKIEVARQAGDREVGRLRWLAAAAVAAWLGTIYLLVSLAASGTGTRFMLGTGSVLLLAALATSMAAQARISEGLAHLADGPGDPATPSSGGAGSASPWLLISGLGVMVVGVLLH